ncbi:hypothetical protein F4776DRAFT_444295 [Hypoxylon sp. NC0597]|nr:hypothetical protein F4776DRAFT_444295 [Hypoxylon sp. NC0597]
MSKRRISGTVETPETKEESTTPPSSPPQVSPLNTVSRADETTLNLRASTMVNPLKMTESATGSPGVNQKEKEKETPSQNDNKPSGGGEAGSQPSTKVDSGNCQQTGSSDKECCEQQPKSK